MNSEHVEVLRGLTEVCRAAIKAGDWKVDGACDPDSLLRRADAALASLSAPQPPAEAIELTACCGREECGGECGNEWRGMEWVRKAGTPPAEARECPHRTRCDCLGACKYGYAGNGALAQQPAAVDEAMVTDEMMERAESAWDVTTNGYGRFITGNNWRECLLADQQGGSDNNRQEGV